MTFRVEIVIIVIHGIGVHRDEFTVARAQEYYICLASATFLDVFVFADANFLNTSVRISSRCFCIAAIAPALPVPSVGRMPQSHSESMSSCVC